jgi:L-ascorbate metabolism protein UlaG (beta-lactamase superfamily)
MLKMLLFVSLFLGLGAFGAAAQENFETDIDCAFLPMNLPYTMTPEMVADAAKAFKPKILYPYHFGDTDTSKLSALMKDTPEVDIIIRSMK